jgi:hypothetical protein
MKVGITGHQELEDVASWKWVEAEIRNALRGQPGPIVGLTSLAKGADQIFARAVLEQGGTLHVVVPFANYERTFPTAVDKRRYKYILTQANTREVLNEDASDEEAFFAAGKRIVDCCDKLIAVWNGKPAGGLGGTADVVEYAKTKQVTVVHINPVTREVRNA